MKIHVFSDLHFEHMWDSGKFFRQLKKLQKKEPADIAILAGDICQIDRHESLWKSEVVQLISNYRKVLFIPGNHEYYGSSFGKADRFLSDLTLDPNFHNLIQLTHGPYECNGFRFIGDTMWFPDTDADITSKRMMSDFSVIGSQAQPFEPLVYQRHQKFLTEVVGELVLDDIVVSHHMPLPKSISPRFAGSRLNPFFVADMTPHLREENLPLLWIHGHGHDPVDYIHQVGDEEMRVYANGYGYPGEGANPTFWDRVAIDI